MTYVVSGCSNSQKILDYELEGIWLKAIVDYFKVLTQNLWAGLRANLWVKIPTRQLLNMKTSATHSHVTFGDTHFYQK